MIDMSYLENAHAYWDEWRFLPWINGSASGLYRRVDFIKAGIIGEIARYWADDYIVWKYEDGDVERILSTAQAEKNLMVQRFVFVRPAGKTTFKSKAFGAGFKGFAEVYQYAPKVPSAQVATRAGRAVRWLRNLVYPTRTTQIADLAYLIDAAYQHSLSSAQIDK